MLTEIVHQILHVLGIDTQQSYWYDLWSGIATQGTVLFAGLSIYRRSLCKKRWCVRFGHYDFTDYEGVKHKLCWHHHPDVTHKHDHLDAMLARYTAEKSAIIP